MSNTNLIQWVEDDIHAFLKDNQKNNQENNQELFFNERDFQMHLAVWLMNSHKYDNVYLEYYIPHKTLDKDANEKIYIWGNELRLDIVVQKGEEYLPIELKYKHKGDKDVGKKTLSRFGEDINANDREKFEIMKSQHAHGRGLYGFWKDVRRLEIISNRYRHVVGGLVVFLTNDHIYWEPTKKRATTTIWGCKKVLIRVINTGSERLLLRKNDPVSNWLTNILFIGMIYQTIKFGMIYQTIK